MKRICSVSLVCALAVVGPVGCGGEADQDSSCELERPDTGDAFENLSDYCFFDGDPASHQPNDGVVAYDITAELYSDQSRKQRFIVLPDGESIGFDAEERWEWPDDTIIVKTFYYPHDERDLEAGRQILETRLLIKRDGQWEAESYIWNDDQSDARHDNLGQRVDVEFIDEDGDHVEIDYRIPNKNQCTTCHNQDGDMVPLGPRTRQLTEPYQRDDSRPAQLVDFADRDMFDESIPPLDELPSMTDPHDEDADTEDRARAYLDANCAHCHGAEGRAGSSNLHLNYDEDSERKLGVCKTPVAAGSAAGNRSHDIVPGKPDESIFIYRMESSDPEVKMPELPITTVDEAGVQLVRDWIAGMEPVGCD